MHDVMYAVVYTDILSVATALGPTLQPIPVFIFQKVSLNETKSLYQKICHIVIKIL